MDVMQGATKLGRALNVRIFKYVEGFNDNNFIWCNLLYLGEGGSEGHIYAL